MYNQMRKFITTGIIVVTLLLMVTASAYSHYMYEWHNDSEAGVDTVGQLTLTCEAWKDGVATYEELADFYYKDSFKREWDRDDVMSFSVVLGDGPGSVIDIGLLPEDGVVMSGAGVQTTSYWVFNTSDNMEPFFTQHVGEWWLTYDHEDCNPVPEPATLTLLGIGLVGLIGGAARKKLKKKAIAKT